MTNFETDRIEAFRERFPIRFLSCSHGFYSTDIENFLKETIRLAEERGRQSGENRILTCMRNVGYDSKPVIKLRREWDKLAKQNAARTPEEPNSTDV